MIVDVGLYVEGKRIEGPSDIAHQVEIARAKGGYVWIGLAEPTQQEFDQVVGELHFHPLAVEDAISARQRPKIEDYGGLTFFVIKTVFYNEQKSDITTGELMFFIDKHFIVIVRHGSGSPLTTVRHDFEKQPEQVKLGPFAVLHAVVDRVIDGYTAIATELENDVIDIETKVFSGNRKTYSQEIYLLKREVIEFRHAIDPLLSPLQQLASIGARHIPPDLTPFFRDALDHLSRASDAGAGLDSLLSSALQAEIAQVQLQQNEDMRKITSYVALAAIPTMVAGVYGMNFDVMPELRWRFGYPAVITFLLLLTAVLYRKFKKSGWL